MSYVPQDVEDFVPPFASNNGVLDGVWANHNEIRDAYEQHIAAFTGRYQTNAADTLLWRFTQKGNKGLGDVVAEVRYVSPGGDFDLELRNAANSVSNVVSITGAATATATLTVTPLSSDDDYEIRITRTAGATVLSIDAIQVYCTAPTVPGSIDDWENAPATNPWLVTDAAVAVEHMTRLLNGPTALAKDRPHCLFSHIRPTRALDLVKAEPDFAEWGREAVAGDADQVQQAGYGAVLIDAPRSRTVTVDAYVLADDAVNTSAILRIGGWTWQPTPNQWDSTTVELAQGLHEVVATVATESGEAAVWHVIQVWRL